MEDVAQAAGVSTATVSRFLNSPNRVAKETADRVQRAIRELGYRPNVFAQGLMTRKSHVIGILLPDIHGEFYSELLRGADAEARRLGYHLLISSESGDGPATMLSSNVIGFMAGLAVMVTEPNEELWQQIKASGLPLVVIDEAIHANGLDRVLVDNASGTREAVNHLLASVRPEDMYFVGGPKGNFDTTERAAVFVQTIAHAGWTPSDEQVRYGEYTVEWGRKAAGALLQRVASRPIGVLAANDEIAFGILQAAQEAHVDVPARLRLVGFDDTRLASLMRPQLSTVRMPTADLGAHAVRVLIDRLAQPQRAGTLTTLPTRLVVRGTSGDPGTESGS